MGALKKMSNEESVVNQLESLVKLGPWLKAIIVGAFMLGLWVATLQLQVTNLTNQVNAIESARKEREDKFDVWKDKVIQETAEVKAEVRAAREDISELKEALKGK